jgi:colanic acid biosynthesis glycosyl transferase WcaI
MRGFDSVVAVSGEMAAALGGETGLGNVRVVRNWADIGVNGRKPDGLAEQMLGEHSRKTVVLYAGSLGRKQGLEVLIDAARLMRGSGAVVVICGEGPALEGLREKARGIENVLFLPHQDEERFAALMNRADIHVIAQQKDAKGAFMPSKLANICACGGALVCVSGENGELSGLARAAGGRLSRPGDTGMLAGIIRRLAAETETRQKMGHKAQALAASCFDKARALSDLEALILPEP